MMTIDEAVTALASLSGTDNEAAHVKADDILLVFLRDNGFDEVADAYCDARGCIGFWYA